MVGKKEVGNKNSKAVAKSEGSKPATVPMKKGLDRLKFVPPTSGQKASDNLAEFAGSWKFIIGFLVFLLVWMCVNVWAYNQHWDPYPFILLNLVLSCLAAIQAPIILMSQNRQSQKDRQKSEYDYLVNRKAERLSLIHI